MRRYDRSHTLFYLEPAYWRTDEHGVPFAFDNHVEMTEMMRAAQGKVMVPINDHPVIRAAFAGHHMMGLDTKYSMANAQGRPQTRRELVIMNWKQEDSGQLF
ncbi:hypothetical protein [Cupriavidus gilardii]|uniref:hypothetical protein n=1 Tax=Cupriavidus gilardii TaxID=82541 RepID=UPI001C2CC68D|nr:hypothetical protein [Cupriavidus gilardii]